MTRDEAILLAVGARYSEEIYDEGLSASEVVARKNAAFLESLAGCGYAVVPIEATREAIEAGREAIVEQSGKTYFPSNANIARAYSAMLTAAQKEQG